MIKVLLFDFARVLLFPKNVSYKGVLNDLYKLKKNKKDFIFENYFYFNDELLDYIKSVKNRFRIIMFTSETIQNDPVVMKKLDGIFEKIISAKEIGFSKTDPEAYRFIVDELQCAPDEILFIDDNADNIYGATEAGLNTHLFKDNKGLIEEINPLVI